MRFDESVWPSCHTTVNRPLPSTATRDRSWDCGMVVFTWNSFRTGLWAEAQEAQAIPPTASRGARGLRRTRPLVCCPGNPPPGRLDLLVATGPGERPMGGWLPAGGVGGQDVTGAPRKRALPAHREARETMRRQAVWETSWARTA